MQNKFIRDAFASFFSNIFIRKYIPLSFLLLISTITMANITGTVFRDYPANGAAVGIYGNMEAVEPGVEGVTVSAYNTSGALESTTISAADGTYVLTTSGGNYRVEFTDWPSYLKESSSANDSTSSVQFVSDGSVSSFGLHNPAQFIGGNIEVVATIATAGQAATNTNASIRKFLYDTLAENDDDTAVINVGNASDTGYVWGMTVDKENGKIYTSASLRRHLDISPDGLGSIYVTDTTSNVTTLFTTIPTADTGVVTATRGLPSNGGIAHHVFYSPLSRPIFTFF